MHHASVGEVVKTSDEPNGGSARTSFEHFVESVFAEHLIEHSPRFPAKRSTRCSPKCKIDGVRDQVLEEVDDIASSFAMCALRAPTHVALSGERVGFVDSATHTALDDSATA